MSEHDRNVTPSTTDSSKQNRPENGTELLPDRLAEIRARLDAATPGEAWNVPNVDYTDADCDLIVNAHADIAWLLDEVERLRGEQ